MNAGVLVFSMLLGSDRVGTWVSQVFVQGGFWLSFCSGQWVGACLSLVFVQGCSRSLCVVGCVCVRVSE